MNLPRLLKIAATALHSWHGGNAQSMDVSKTEPLQKHGNGLLACFLPRHSSLPEIADCCNTLGPCIAERAFLNQQLKAVTLYLTPSFQALDIAEQRSMLE